MCNVYADHTLSAHQTDCIPFECLNVWTDRSMRIGCVHLFFGYSIFWVFLKFVSDNCLTELTLLILSEDSRTERVDCLLSENRSWHPKYVFVFEMVAPWIRRASLYGLPFSHMKWLNDCNEIIAMVSRNSIERVKPAAISPIETLTPDGWSNSRNGYFETKIRKVRKQKLEIKN